MPCGSLHTDQNASLEADGMEMSTELRHTEITLGAGVGLACQ